MGDDEEVSYDSILEALADKKQEWSDWTEVIADRRQTPEEKLREEFPSLQDAWEKYQILLKMCKSSKPQDEGGRKVDPIIAQNLLNLVRKSKAKGIANDKTNTQPKTG